MSDEPEEEKREEAAEEPTEEPAGTQPERAEQGEEEGSPISNVLLGAAVVTLCGGIYSGVFMMAESALPAVLVGAGIMVGFVAIGFAIQAGLPSDVSHWQTTRTKVFAYVIYVAAVIGAFYAGLTYQPLQRYWWAWFLVLALPMLPVVWLLYGIYCQWGGIRLVGWAACVAALIFYFLPMPYNGGVGYQLLQQRCSACWRRATTARGYMLEGERVRIHYCSLHEDDRPEITRPGGRRRPPTIAGLPDIFKQDLPDVAIHGIGLAGGALLGVIGLLLGRSIYRRGTVPTVGAILLACAMLGLSYFYI